MKERAPFPPASLRWRGAAWQLMVLFGVLQCALTGGGMFFAISSRMGSFSVYIVSDFHALIVILPMLLIRRFGVGTAVSLPAAVVGFFLEDSLAQQLIVGSVAPLGWSIVGLLTGCSAELAKRFRPVPERWRAILRGISMGRVNCFLTLVAAAFFSKHPFPEPTCAGIAFFALPWLLLKRAFGGSPASAISRHA